MKHPIFRLRFWHRWLGIMALLPLLIAAVSGVLLVYKKPIINALVTGATTLPENYTQDSILAQMDTIELRIHAFEAIRAKAPNPEEPYWTLTNKQGQHQLISVVTLTPFQYNLWLLDTFTFIHNLHLKLLSGRIGQTILLISALASLILLGSGIYLWWPGRKGFRWRFIKPWNLTFSSALKIHRHTGVVVTPILVVILMTASIMLWQKLIFRLLAPLPMQNIVAEQGHNDLVLKGSSALALARKHITDGQLTYVRIPQDDNQFYRFRFRLPDEWHPNGRTSVNVYAQTGSVKSTPRSDEMPWQYRLINQSYPLHSGYGINGPYQLLVLLGGLALGWLAVTGLLSYLRQRFDK